MSNIDRAVKLIHAPLNVLPLKLLAIVMALTVTGLLMWEPRQFAEDIGGFSAGLAPLMIWATCSAWYLVWGSFLVGGIFRCFLHLISHCLYYCIFSDYVFYSV
ncbi:cyd operon YbgE family protein [Photobacterium kishitanii]|uniref:cyd operon YbgE family protein n=1 Tax=Photobacterium kishitanii TaxID=318456 RepID=UPI000A3F141B